MKIGVGFPQTEIGADLAVIRDYAQAVEAMGYTHILAFDSVVGANPDRPGGWDSQYDYRHALHAPPAPAGAGPPPVGPGGGDSLSDSRHAFHEPLVLFGFLAGVTRRIELVTGILILPQRQAKLGANEARGGRAAPGG